MKRLYTIHDAAALLYLPPFLANTNAEAERMFIGSLGPSFPHRMDYTLFAIAQWDDDEGKLTTMNPPVKILSGSSIDASMSPELPLPLEQSA